MSNEASRLLRNTEEEISTIECIECGRECPIDVDLCPHCGHISKLIQLKELGRKLPIGLLEVQEQKDGVATKEILLKDFDVIAVDWNIERDISNTWKKLRLQPGVGMLDYLVCVLVHTLVSLGGMNFRKHKENRRIAILNNMFGGDIFYMYTYSRIVSIGDILTFKDVECARCSHIFDYPVDLQTLDVACRNDPKSLYKWVELRDGFETAGEIRKKVKMRPSTFVSLAHAPSDNEAEMFRVMVRDAVVAIEGLPEGATMNDSDVQQLTKWDMSLLAEEVELVGGGPDWFIEGVCPKCSMEFQKDVDWQYQNFFRQSSRSKRRRRRSRR